MHHLPWPVASLLGSVWHAPLPIPRFAFMFSDDAGAYDELDSAVIAKAFKKRFTATEEALPLLCFSVEPNPKLLEDTPSCQPSVQLHGPVEKERTRSRRTRDGPLGGRCYLTAQVSSRWRKEGRKDVCFFRVGLPCALCQGWMLTRCYQGVLSVLSPLR